MIEREDDGIRVDPSEVGGNADIVRASEIIRELHELTERNDWPVALMALTTAGDVGVLPDGQVAEHGACFTIWHLPDEIRSAAIMPGFGWFGLLFSIMFRLWGAAVERPEAERVDFLLRANRKLSEAAR